ncbi:zf-HC2 domain-containing protein [Actinocrispum sp. NPDC049592]|uniref:anti-sigma factor family protein n=1 Tax=Actinocrispum sp. NPDC049592 TaxID=3154835 RepID=UPI003438ECBB
MTCRRTVSLGAYLLGALDPGERAGFEDHLTTCATCKAELLRLAPLPGLLQRLTPADYEAIEAGDEVPDWPADFPVELELVDLDLPEDLVPPQPRRPGWLSRNGRALAAAAAIVLLALGGFVMFAPPSPDSNVQAVAPVTWTATDPATGVTGKIDLIRRGWGTELHLSMESVPEGRKLCDMRVYRRDGTSEIAGQWTAGTYKNLRSAPGSTSIPISDIDRIEITAGGGVLVGIRAS